MTPELIFFLILAVVVALGATLLALFVYSGLFTDVEVRTGSSPFRRLRIFYKFQTGPYKNVVSLFTEAINAAPGLRTIGIYYDDPEKVAPEELRACVGSIVEEGGVPQADNIEKHIETLQKHGFKELSLPPVPTVVYASFPWNTNMSILMAIKKTYPQIKAFLKERRLHAGPFVEIYDDGTRSTLPFQNRRNSDADDMTINSDDKANIVRSESAAVVANDDDQGPRIMFWAPLPSCEDYFCPEAVQSAIDVYEQRQSEKQQRRDYDETFNGLDDAERPDTLRADVADIKSAHSEF